MAIMTLPLNIPPTPSPASSPPSDDSSNIFSPDNVPPTPVSPSQQQKRKPSRRANTAERRATHNAVERQRRENLNGRFLDLAALLPNLSQIRRPSKSSIVNSSIAHIHASRRHRLLAARELRLLKLEADALRRELNEWRERSGIPRIEEPVRGDGFGIILGAELEVIVGHDMEEEDDDDFVGPLDSTSNNGPTTNGQMWDSNDLDDFAIDVPNVDEARVLAMLKTQGQNGHPFAHSPTTAIVPPSSLPQILPRPGATNVPAFDGLYDHSHPQQIQLLHQQQQQQQQQQYIQQQQRQQEQEKMWDVYHQNHRMPQTATQFSNQTPYPNQYANNTVTQQQMLIQAQRTLFTPPATSHGLPSPTTSTGPIGNGNSPSPPVSDHSQSHRERSGSVHSTHSHASSSLQSRSSHSPSYELGLGLGINSTVGVGVDYMTSAVGVDYGMARMMGTGEMSLASPISVGGGGGSGGAFAMMM